MSQITNPKIKVKTNCWLKNDLKIIKKNFAV